MDTTVGSVVLLLPVAPARSKAALKASVDKLFDEGGSGDQVDSAAGGSQNIVIGADVENVAAKTVVAKKPTRYRKKRPAATDGSGSSHPPKKLREDYRTSGGTATGGKSPSAIKELLERSILNAKIGVAVVATLPFVTSSVSATPEPKGGDLLDSITGPNLRTIGPFERFVISSDSSHHSSNSATEAEVDSVIRSVAPPVMAEATVIASIVSASSVPPSGTAEKVVSPARPSIFLDSSSTDTIKPDAAGPSHLSRKELSMRSREVSSELQDETFVPRWNVPIDTLLDDHDIYRKFIDHLAPPVLMRTEYCLSEKRRLETECEKQAGLMNSKDDEIESLKAQLSLKEAEAAKAIRLRAHLADVEATKKVRAEELNALKQKNVDLKGEKDSFTMKITDLQSSVSAKDLELEGVNVVVHGLEATCSGLRNQVSGYEHLEEQIKEFQDAQMDVISDKLAKLELLTHGVKLAVIKCLNSLEYLTALGTAISRAIENGMQDGLEAGIDHGKHGRNLEDLVAYNPSAEEDYNSSLQELCAVDFSLRVELKSQKDTSVETIMDLLRLESPLANAPGMSDLQPDIDQLSSHSSVERSSGPWPLADVYVPLVNPLSIQNLTGAAGTSDSVSTAAATITALSMGSSQGKGEWSVASLIDVEFENEELDTTP
ncbi:hypothetical protein Tco_1279884 [Tanacetum coccineum]